MSWNVIASPIASAVAILTILAGGGWAILKVLPERRQIIVETVEKAMSVQSTLMEELDRKLNGAREEIEQNRVAYAKINLAYTEMQAENTALQYERKECVRKLNSVEAEVAELRVRLGKLESK